MIETNSTWSLLIAENDPRNLSIQQAIEIIKENGLEYTIGNNPLGRKIKEHNRN